MENDKIMGALIAGLVKVIDAFADKVAKRPLEIIILVLVSVGLAFKLNSAEKIVLLLLLSKKQLF